MLGQGGVQVRAESYGIIKRLVFILNADVVLTIGVYTGYAVYRCLRVVDRFYFI